jgi:photosystem II PsbU protein
MKRFGKDAHYRLSRYGNRVRNTIRFLSVLHPCGIAHRLCVGLFLGVFEIEHLSLLDVSLCQLLISPLILPSCSAVAAFAPASNTQRPATELAAERREFLSQAAGFAGLAAFAPAAFANRDYENVGLLGGSNIVDINNANVRVYLKMPGLYPTIAGKIVTNGPYKSVSEIYSIPGLTGPQKETIKKYESRFAAKEPSADYVIDIFNNGLYR